MKKREAAPVAVSGIGPGGTSRLDAAMVARGLVETRARAADLVRRGAVQVDGAAARKAGQMVGAGARIEFDPAANQWVARSGAKLAAALDAFGFGAEGLVALDIGASTGGFTEVLLARGAARVYAVDVGSGQLHPRIAADPRVVSLEGVDARALSRREVPEAVGVIVADVSFISLKQALPVPLSLTGDRASLVVLVKPQFEAGRAEVGKRGIVREDGVRRAVVDDIAAWITARGWRVVGDMVSPLPGKEGNIEHLIGAVKA